MLKPFVPVFLATQTLDVALRDAYAFQHEPEAAGSLRIVRRFNDRLSDLKAVFNGGRSTSSPPHKRRKSQLVCHGEAHHVVRIHEDRMRDIALV